MILVRGLAWTDWLSVFGPTCSAGCLLIGTLSSEGVLGMSDPFVTYKAGVRLTHTRFAWIWESQEAVLPSDFENKYQEYCREYELDPEDKDNVEMFIAEHVDDWGVGEWEETDRDTQDSTWEVSQ